MTILGTAASVPTDARSTSATVLSLAPTRVLIDCGEGTQRRLLQCDEMAQIDLVCLTHLHADHVLGLPGLLATWSLAGRVAPLTIAGPTGTARWLERAAFLTGRLSFEVEVVEVGDGDELLVERGRMRALATRHGLPSVGWIWCEDHRPGSFSPEAAMAAGVPKGPMWGRLQRGETVVVDGRPVSPEGIVEAARRGRVIALSGDTRPLAEWGAACRGADVMVHEATFEHADRDRARARKHSTGLEAARVAVEAEVVRLVLTHISARARPSQLRAEAQRAGASVWVARDGDRITVPYPERGVPTLERV